MIHPQTALDNFYLTAEQLEATPSRADGIDAGTEAELRRYCCDVVAEAVVLLRLPQVVAATAQVLVQRFYCKRSLKRFDVKVVAMAAFWLASKLEEVIEIDDPHRLTLRSVVMVVDRVTRRREGRPLTVLDPYSQKYEELKMQATTVERHMLRAFGFVLHVEHPHRFILNYCQMLMKESHERRRALQQEAWNMANDSLRTSLCVRFRAEIVACGILFTAARKLQIALPESPPWWALFEVQESELVEVCRTLCQLYSRERAANVPLVAAPGGGATSAAAAGARSPQSQQPTPPLRSPATGTQAVSGLGPAARTSEGEVPSVPGLLSSGTAHAPAVASEAQQPSAAPSPGHGAASGAAASSAPADKQQQEDTRENGSRSERRRSRSRSRGRDDRGSRRRSRSSSSRSRSRSRSSDRGKRRRGRNSRSRSRSPGGRDGARRGEERRRERREDQPLYRPGKREERVDDRRRPGTHRPRTRAAPIARGVAAAAV